MFKIFITYVPIAVQKIIPDICKHLNCTGSDGTVR